MFVRRNLQLNRNDELIHLLSIEGLPAGIRSTSDTPAPSQRQRPRGQEGAAAARQSVFNLFFEN
jgi:aspartate carbamoyltransferase catalytic subunit